MPELPDISVYVEHLDRRCVGRALRGVRLFSPFVLRSVEPPPDRLVGTTVRSVQRLGKQIVWAFDGSMFLVVHLMVAGRFQWKRAGAKAPGRIGLAAFDFDEGTLLLTEASTKKRASVHVVSGEDRLREFDRGGLEVLSSTPVQFAAALRKENHTLKRALTDPRLFSGIGNAYSDEILHRARLSPLSLTSRIGDDEAIRLFEAVRSVMAEWIGRLRQQAGEEFPSHVTAFHPEMAVHGRFRQPCPVCSTPVQRIVYAENECNYCPRCQTGGKILADRSLSRLLKDDWPRSVDEL